jgi:hypothetical protein
MRVTSDREETAISRFALSNLAIKAAIELERLRKGKPLRRQILIDLARALSHTANPDPDNTSHRFFEVGYQKPFMRLYRDRTTADPRSIADVQEYLQKMAVEIQSFLASPDVEKIDELASFCADLHHELASGLMSETRIEQRWPEPGYRYSPSCFC